jgi:hypothetical protein
MQHALYRTTPESSVHQLLRHEEAAMGYRILILIAAILITGCEALVFVGDTAGLN